MHAGDVQSLLEQGAEPLLKALRAAGVRMSYQRALRCVKDGIRGIHLPAIRVGGRWHTSPDAVRTFVEQTTAAALQRTDSPQRMPTGTGARYLRALGLDQASLLAGEAPRTARAAGNDGQQQKD